MNSWVSLLKQNLTFKEILPTNFVFLFAGNANMFCADFGIRQNKIEPAKLMMNPTILISNPFLKNLFTNRKQIGNTLLIQLGDQVYRLLRSSKSLIHLLQVLANSFDGFQSLGMTWASWDSLKNYYYSKIRLDNKPWKIFSDNELFMFKIKRWSYLL